VAETTPFTIGAEAHCTDGRCGEVRRVIIDPVARELTHLVVEPRGRHEHGRLVPLDLVDASAGEVRIRCTRAEFAQLEPAEETRFVAGDYTNYGPDHVLSWPYYGLGSTGVATGMGRPAGGRQTDTEDTVPVGEVDVRRGDPVYATDGSIGRVHGLVIDRQTRHVTHVLLAEGHLWGKKEVAIPIGSVTRVDEDIKLNITKQQVEDLPPVDIDHPAAG
jgi:sporulation protein YlmC with PRC-barrel domain